MQSKIIPFPNSRKQQWPSTNSEKIIKPPLCFYSFHNVYIWSLFGTMFKLFLWYFTKVIQTVIQGEESEAMLDKVQSIKSGLAFSRSADGAQL